MFIIVEFDIFGFFSILKLARFWPKMECVFFTFFAFHMRCTLHGGLFSWNVASIVEVFGFVPYPNWSDFDQKIVTLR